MSRCRSLSVVLSVLAVVGLRAVWGAVDELNGVCVPQASTTYFRPDTQSCASCPSNSTYAAGRCGCDLPYFGTVTTATASLGCDDCRQSNMGRSILSGRCIPCGGGISANGAAGTLLPRPYQAVKTSAGVVYALEDASFNSSGLCGCASALSELIESFDGVSLGFYACLTCINQTNGASVFRCPQPCESPMVWNPQSARCECPAPTFTADVDGRCAVSSALDTLASTIGLTAFTIPVKNLDNSGANGASAASWRVAQYSVTGAYWCQQGNASACNLLANLCVLSSYELNAAPCILYRFLQSKETCRGLDCERPQTLPWLYYLRASPLILLDTSVAVPLALRPTSGAVHALQFVLSAFTWNGTWLGNTIVTNQLDLCDLPAVEAQQFFNVGVNQRVYCWMNLQWYTQQPETIFYDLFVLDAAGNMLEVPALLDWGDRTLEPRDVHDGTIYRDGSDSDGTPSEAGYRRRFYLFDNIGAVSTKGGPVNSVTYARRVMLLISLYPDHSSRMYTPLLIIQYASVISSSFSTNRLLKYGQMRTLKTNRTNGLYVASGATLVKFSLTAYSAERGLMITLTTLCCVCFFSAWIRTYFWMRRQQDLVPGFGALIRFFLYACNHVGNLFFLVVVITSGYFYLFYKHQASVDYLLPDNSKYFFAMLYTATCAKGIVCLNKLLEQVRIDWFVVDWERSRGVLLRENKEAAVTMWRSTFVANELNELQLFRYWNPLFCMVLVMAFLEGLHYVDLARTVPSAIVGGSLHSPPHKILRVAIDSFFWFIVPLVIYVLQFHIWYRFWAVHPLRGFIDLCSVSNISIVMLLEGQYGFYIHGESIHAHADASMAEFQENLRREAQGNLPHRGLGGREDCQVFEIYIGGWLRQGLNICYADLFEEYMKALGGAVGKPSAGKHRNLLEILTGSPGQVQAFTERTLEIKSNINDMFRNSVRAGEKILRAKDPAHKYLDVTPNLLYMNGPFAGEKAGSDLYFVDEFDAYHKGLLAGVDFDLWILYTLLFAATDSSVFNTYAAVVVIYLLDWLLVWFRDSQGQANLGAKTMFDERFFV